MIILVSGASHTGKTMLAQRLLEKYKCPYLCIDHLKMGLIRSGYTRLTPEDDEALTEYLWPVVREMVKTAVENRQDLIVEGCYIPFDWRKDFDERYLSSIRYVCLVMTDRYIESHWDEILSMESVVESRLEACALNTCDMKRDNRAFREGCEANGENIVLIDDDYVGTLDALLESL